MKRLGLAIVILVAAAIGGLIGMLVGPRPAHALWLECKDVAYTSNGTSNSCIFTPTNGQTHIFIHVVPEDAGTFDVQYRDDENNWWTMGDGDNLAVTAGVASQVFLVGAEISALRIRYTNNDASAGSFDVEFKEGGQF